jgi:hypothetical protein
MGQLGLRLCEPPRRVANDRRVAVALVARAQGCLRLREPAGLALLIVMRSVRASEQSSRHALRAEALDQSEQAEAMRPEGHSGRLQIGLPAMYQVGAAERQRQARVGVPLQTEAAQQRSDVVLGERRERHRRRFCRLRLGRSAHTIRNRLRRRI